MFNPWPWIVCIAILVGVLLWIARYHRRTIQQHDTERAKHDEEMKRQQAEHHAAMDELHQIVEELKHIGHTDELTQLPNRRRAIQFINEVACRTGSCCFLLLDVDHFKRVNDTYGHDAGDAVLVEVAQILRRAVRREDLPARYGGEEFLITLVGLSLDKAKEIAERIREALDTEVGYHGQKIKISASLGLGCTAGRGIRETLRAVDEAVYKAKQLGRNRVVVAEDAPPEEAS